MSTEHREKYKETILVIEDDQTMIMGLELNLSAEGYRVLVARDGLTGLKLALEADPDLLILDLMLPGLDGYDILAQLRERERELPVIILSARVEESDKLDGFQLGADDYVTKPFSLKELLARVQVAFKRCGPGKPISLRQQYSAFEVDLGTRQAFRNGQEVPLTPREYDLLAYLISHGTHVHSRDHLLTVVWGDDYEGTARTVDNFIHSLRLKLEEDPARPRHLLTVRGAGYRFDDRGRG